LSALLVILWRWRLSLIHVGQNGSEPAWKPAPLEIDLSDCSGSTMNPPGAGQSDTARVLDEEHVAIARIAHIREAMGDHLHAVAVPIADFRLSNLYGLVL
jgi:hypothetical protein